jgi:DNA replication protein DnaC
MFIEDLGRAPKSPRGGKATWWVDLFFEFVDRHEMEQNPVVYTTNFNKKMLRNLLGGAVVERLYGNCDVVVLQGPNRREDS